MSKPLSPARRAMYERLREQGHFSKAGKKGGKNNVAKHGRQHMSEIGRIGGKAGTGLVKFLPRATTTAVNHGKGENQGA